MKTLYCIFLLCLSISGFSLDLERNKRLTKLDYEKYAEDYNNFNINAVSLGEHLDALLTHI